MMTCVQYFQDWNIFLQNFAELEFCIIGNNTELATTISTATVRASKRGATKVKPQPSHAPETTATGHILEYEGPRYEKYWHFLVCFTVHC